MESSILPTHAPPVPLPDDKSPIPGGYPQTEKPDARSRRKPKRKNTALTIDSAAEPERYSDAEADGLFTSSPMSDNGPQSGSPAHETKHGTRAKKATTARQRRSRKQRLGGTSQENQGPWLQISEQLGTHDDKMVRSWNEQVDTLLVFAGLFSAVITEFNNEAYQLLLPDPVDESKAILSHISLQLVHLPAALRSGDAIPELSTPPPFQASLADVAVSTLWYSSLVCALIAASLGMLVKQWLQHYMKDDYSSTRERLRVRQLRYRGLCNWQVPAIIAFLPLLLRIALTLFLSGLIVFMHSLHPIVMWSVTSLIIIWLFSYSSSLVLPTIFTECPYKAPESLVFYIASRLWHDGMKSTLDSWAFGYLSWSDPEEFVKKDVAEDPNILATLDRTFSDAVLEVEIRSCCRDMDEDSVMRCVNQVLRQRLRIRSDEAAWNHPDGIDVTQQGRLTRRAAEALVNILIDTMERALDDTMADDQGEESWLNSSFKCLTLLLETTLWPMETTLDDRLIGLLLKLVHTANVTDVTPYGNMGSDYQLFILEVLGLRPSLLRKELMPLLPFLYAAAGDHFGGRGAVDMVTKICRAVLSIVVYADPSSLEKDYGFTRLLFEWQVAMHSLTLNLAHLPSSAKFAVEHDVHCCRVKAAELGEAYIAEQLCARLEKALMGTSSEFGTGYS